jgi:hypothetical protein
MEASRNLESIHESPLPCALASREVAFKGLTISTYSGRSATLRTKLGSAAVLRVLPKSCPCIASCVRRVIMRA